MLSLLIIFTINNYKDIYLKHSNFYFIVGYSLVIICILAYIDISWITYLGNIILFLTFLLIGSIIFKIKYFLKNNKHSTVISHIGFSIFIIGAIISNLGQYEVIKIISPGQSIQIRNIEYIFRGINYSINNNFHSYFGNFLVKISNKNTTLFPEKRYYFIKGIYTSKSNIKSNILSDIYAMIGDGNMVNGWYIRLYHSPLMMLVWFGSILMFLSGIILIIYLCLIKPKKYINWL